LLLLLLLLLSVCCGCGCKWGLRLDVAIVIVGDDAKTKVNFKQNLAQSSLTSLL